MTNELELIHAGQTRRRSVLWATPLVFLLSALGCMKQGAGETSYYPGADTAMQEQMAYPAESPGYAGSPEREYAAYDFEEDLSGGEFKADGAVLGAKATETTTLDYRTDAPAKDKAKAEPAPAQTPGTVAGGGDEAGKQNDDDQPDHGRQIIYTASLQIGVYNLGDAMKTVEDLPEKYGGWVHMRTEGQVIMRIPADGLRNVMDELGKLGVVQSRTLQAQDVTAEYVDLESRIKVLEETQEQLLALLDKAKTVEEALHVRKALDDVTMELEVALGRMRQLSNLIAFSTLTVYLNELGPTTPIPSSNDPFPWVNELGVETTEWR